MQLVLAAMAALFIFIVQLTALTAVVAMNRPAEERTRSPRNEMPDEQQQTHAASLAATSSAPQPAGIIAYDTTVYSPSESSEGGLVGLPAPRHPYRMPDDPVTPVTPLPDVPTTPWSPVDDTGAADQWPSATSSSRPTDNTANSTLPANSARMTCRERKLLKLLADSLANLAEPEEAMQSVAEALADADGANSGEQATRLQEAQAAVQAAWEDAANRLAERVAAGPPQHRYRTSRSQSAQEALHRGPDLARGAAAP